MELKYCAITANCGNSTLGNVATQQIMDHIQTHQLDFCVINCQEAQLSETNRQLKRQFEGTDYDVACVGSMFTLTKFSFKAMDAGLATYVIYNPNKLDLNKKKSISARRSNMIPIGTAYNKGGLISYVELVDKENNSQRIALETISGHLDSNHADARTQDWLIIQQSLAKPSSEVNTFQQLEMAIPHLRIAGYDANTRNQYSETGVQNRWDTDVPEIYALKQAPLGTHRYSHVSTYSNTADAHLIASNNKKRRGQTKGGMLDFVSILDGEWSVSVDATIIPPNDSSTDRDHAVVISPVCTYTLAQSNFERIKHYIAAALAEAAPDLAQDIYGLDENERNRSHLIGLYKRFLSQDQGLLLKKMASHVAKLKEMRTSSDRGRIFSQPMQPWFLSCRLDNDQLVYMDSLKPTMAETTLSSFFILNILNQFASLIAYALKSRLGIMFALGLFIISAGIVVALTYGVSASSVIAGALTASQLLAMTIGVSAFSATMLGSAAYGVISNHHFFKYVTWASHEPTDSLKSTSSLFLRELKRF